MPVQLVNRPNLDFRGFCGRVAQGRVKVGDDVRVLPSGVTSKIREIVVWDKNLDSAEAGDSVTLTLTDEIDVSRGDLIVAADNPPQVADQFEARLLWMSEQPLLVGRPYLLKLHTKEVTATITSIKYREDVNSGAHLAAKSLALNEIAVVNISLRQAVVFEPYAINRILGGFILIDKLTMETSEQA
jgi:bifunctional enzyme CysN/CysC